MIGAIGPPVLDEGFEDDRPSSSNVSGTKLLQRRWRAARRREQEQARARVAAYDDDDDEGGKRHGAEDDGQDEWSDGAVGVCVCMLLFAGVAVWCIFCFGGIFYGLMLYQNATVADVIQDFHRTRAKNLALNGA